MAMDSLSLLACQGKLDKLGEVLNNNLPQKNAALGHAARQGKHSCVGILLDHGAQVDHQDSHYIMAPIHWAAINGHTEVVRKLKARGARVDTRDKAGRTPHRLALLYRHSNTALLINGNGTKAITANGPGDEFCIAACTNKVDELKCLLNNGAHPDTINSFEDPALHHAIRVDNTQCVEALLRAGADPLSAHSYDFTPLHWAALYGRVQIGHLLMNYGAWRTVTALDVSGRTPAEVGKAYNHPRDYKAWEFFEGHMSMILRIDEPTITVTHKGVEVLKGTIRADPESPEAKKLLPEGKVDSTLKVKVSGKDGKGGTFNLYDVEGDLCGMEKDRKVKKEKDEGAATAAAGDPAGTKTLKQKLEEFHIKKEVEEEETEEWEKDEEEETEEWEKDEEEETEEWEKDEEREFEEEEKKGEEETEEWEKDEEEETEEWEKDEGAATAAAGDPAGTKTLEQKLEEFHIKKVEEREFEEEEKKGP